MSHSIQNLEKNSARKLNLKGATDFNNGYLCSKCRGELSTCKQKYQLCLVPGSMITRGFFFQAYSYSSPLLLSSRHSSDPTP